MARIPGRSSWLAWPAGLLCAAVVAGLVWLALPMVPVAVAWVGDTLRTATAATSAPAAAPSTPGRGPLIDAAESEASIDCRTFYPSDLWLELAWRPQGLLAQDFSPPATSVTSLVDALAPTVRLSCRWEFADASITSTLARVGDGSAAVAEAALRGEGFACTTTEGVLECRRARGEVVEEHALSGDLWLSSVETGPAPDDYGTRLAEALWSGR